MKTLIFRSSILLLLLGLAACGGTKMLKEPEALVVPQALAAASDQHLSATLDWVIFRNGPGTWARNVDWDEYLIRVYNSGDDSIQLTNITVIDSLGTPAEVGVSRKKLVKASKKTKKRYKGQGLEIKAGVSAGTLLAAGAVTIAAAGSALGAVVLGGSSAVAVGAATGILLAPVLAVGGIVRGVNNSMVNKQIESRQTLLPIMLQEEEEKHLDIFFPLSPSPRQVQLTYVDSGGEHTLIIDTQAALEGLHLVKTAE